MEEKKSIHILVPASLHKEIRIAAAEQDTSIMQFCIVAVLEQLRVLRSSQDVGK